jgi:hypothetical protein
MSQLSPDPQIMLLTALNAFMQGWAGPAHFDIMLDTRDLLLLAAKAKKESAIVEAARAFNVALANIRESWDGDKFSVNDDELNALKMLIDISNDFWARQSGNLFHMAYRALKQCRLEQERETNEDQRKQAGSDQSGLVCG